MNTIGLMIFIVVVLKVAGIWSNEHAEYKKRHDYYRFGQKRDK